LRARASNNNAPPPKTKIPSFKKNHNYLLTFISLVTIIENLLSAENYIFKFKILILPPIFPNLLPAGATPLHQP